MEIVLKIAAASMAAVLFYLLYSYSFFRPKEYKIQIISFFFGFSSVGLSLLLQSVAIGLFSQPSVFTRAFFIASIPEEISKMAIIFLLVRFNKGSVDSSIAQLIFYSILIGMSFGFLENIFYSLNTGMWPVLLRSITSLPLHIMTAAIWGYYLALFENSNKDNLAWLNIAKAFFLTTVIHGIYDYSVLSGNLFAVPVILLVTFVTTEYVIARSKTCLPESVLSMIGLKVDDYECLRSHRHYIRWLDIEQAKGSSRNLQALRKPAKWSFASFLFFSITGTFMYYLYSQYPEKTGIWFPGIGFAEYLNIFIFYPLFLSFDLLFAGTLNPEFIAEKITKVPLIIITLIECEGYAEDSIIYAIDKKILFATLQKPEMLQGKLKLSFWIAGKSIGNLPARVLWRNQSEENIAETGALILLEKFHFGLTLRWSFSIIKHIMKNILISIKKS